MSNNNKAYQFVKILHSDSDSPHECPQKSIFHKIGVKLNCMHSKTAHCKHEFGCLENALTDSTKSFAYGYSIRMLISLVGLVAKAKNPGLAFKKLWDCLVASGNFKFGAFLGVMTLLMKGLICLLRKIRNKDDWKNSFFSGVIAGYFSLFFIQSKSRLVFTTFFLSRAFDCYYNSLVKKGVIKDSKFNHVLIFMVLNGFTVYARSHEPYLLPPSLTRFYDFVYARGPMEIQLENVLTELTRRRLVRSNVMG